MDRPLRVLLVEDDPDDAFLVQRMVAADRGMIRLSHVETLKAARDRLAADTFDVLLLDLSLPDSGGVETCTALRRAAPQTPIVVRSGLADEGAAVEAVQRGAQDYLIKGRVDADVLRRAMRYAIERRQAEERDRATEKLQALRELASGVAHHLNNVLAVINAQVDLLLAREMPQEPDVTAALRVASRAVNYGAEVVRRLQTFTVTRPSLTPASVDLNELVHEVLDLSRPLWQDGPRARGILIGARLEAGEIPAVAGEPLALRQVLMNLLINAIEALPRGGHIGVRTWAAGDSVYCAVTDDGVSMTESVRQRALEPFFTTKGPSSTGLGLSVVHGILVQHGGGLSIESDGRQGTTVTIHLPVATIAR